MESGIRYVDEIQLDSFLLTRILSEGGQEDQKY